MILISSMLPPPADLLDQAVKTNDLEPLEHWFIRQTSPGYSFQTIAEFVEQERSKISKPKAKRAPSAKTKTRKATTTKQKAEAKIL
jgi:hypothetical protein